MKRLAFLLGIGLVGSGAVAPRAAANPAHPAGVQEAPPRAPASRPPLDQDPRGRRAVRGCPVGEPCTSSDLVEFEYERFGRGNPWIERDQQVRVVRQGKSPTELRPDLPWLAGLEMPDLPVRWDDRLIEYLLFYKEDPRGQAIMRGWLHSQGRFRDLVLRELRRARLPEDLLYVAMIESSYDPDIKSYAGAAGLWQLMPDAGRIYGLEINRWIDERNDPVRSTAATVDYWADLYQRFGDWSLALAAYNGGYGAVLRAISRYNSNDFWLLCTYENALPFETGLYVPKALAAAIVGHNREVFGFGDVVPAPAETWEDVRVPTSISLEVAARAAGVSTDALRRLNPHLRRGRTPPAVNDFVLRVPVGTSTRFAEKLAALKGDWDGFDAYVVAYGERLEDVATQFGISTRRLRELNAIEHDGDIGGGTMLVVPKVAAQQRQQNLARAKDDLHASGVDQKPGEPLIVAVPDKDASVAGKRRVFYRVVAGDTVAAVARVLGVDGAELLEWNGITQANLQPRQVVQAWVAPSFDASKAKVRLLDESRLLVVTRGSPEHLDLAEARVGRERIEYVATKRESIETIAKKFGLGPRDLGRINKMSPNRVLSPGDKIIVYRVVDRTRSDRAAEQWKKMPKDAKKAAEKSAKEKRTAVQEEPTKKAPATDSPNDKPAPKGGVEPKAEAAPKGGAEPKAEAAPKGGAEPGPVSHPADVE